MLVLVVTNMYPTAEWPYLGTFVFDQVESLKGRGIDVDVLHVRREALGKSAYRRLATTVSERARALSPDVVHVMYGGVLAEAATRAEVAAPVVLSLGGTDLFGGRVGGPLARLRERVGVLASRRAARRADGVIVKSDGLRAALPADIDGSRVWTIPNGVDLERFAPLERAEARTQLGWPPDEPVVLFPARPVRLEKRFDLAQAAVAELRKTRPDVRLRPLDGVPRLEVPSWMNASDAIIMTSSHEGSPNAVKEALACNTPVVAVDVGDIRERIGGVPGCAIAERDPTALAQALDAALQTPRSNEGRRRVEELSLPRVAAQVAEVYAAVSRRS